MISTIAAGVVGILLGLLGGGGSLLILPVLVYLVGLDPVEATSYSLVIVGVAALVGAVDYVRNGLVSFPSVAGFGIPSVVGVFVTRSIVMPRIPDVLYESTSFSLNKNTLVMVIFAVMALASSWSMLRRRPQAATAKEQTPRRVKTAIAGLVVGLLTGFVGAGGGFLIVPALMFLLLLPVREAIATSLFVIALKSLLGFLGDVLILNGIQWSLLGRLTLAAVIGIHLGVRLNRKVSPQKLKTVFGWVVLIIATAILAREVFFP